MDLFESLPLSLCFESANAQIDHYTRARYVEKRSPLMGQSMKRGHLQKEAGIGEHSPLVCQSCQSYPKLTVLPK